MKNTTEVDMQLLAIPGIRNEYVTTYALNMVRDRFDSLYLMDINYYDDNSLLTEDCREANIKITAQQFNSRAVDNSFGATYFPDITLIDPDINSEVFVPSSAAVLRAYATNDTVGKLWNAPAGYNRANLNQSGAKLLRSFNEGNTDSLYNERINPIILEQGQAAPVVWGQKTLQLANTSLNRINVRRLLLSLRRQVRSVANRFIFEPNRESTLARFSSLVEPILANIQTLNGISQYKVQIDTSTTTQQDIENNIVRGKIFIVPINSVEFISIDFEVTK
jgi:phage tail sheath protein FI